MCQEDPNELLLLVHGFLIQPPQQRSSSIISNPNAPKSIRRPPPKVATSRPPASADGALGWVVTSPVVSLLGDAPQASFFFWSLKQRLPPCRLSSTSTAVERRWPENSPVISSKPLGSQWREPPDRGPGTPGSPMEHSQTRLPFSLGSIQNPCCSPHRSEIVLLDDPVRVVPTPSVDVLHHRRSDILLARPGELLEVHRDALFPHHACCPNHHLGIIFAGVHQPVSLRIVNPTVEPVPANVHSGAVVFQLWSLGFLRLRAGC